MTAFSPSTTLPIIRTHVIDAQTQALVASLKQYFSTPPLIVLNGPVPEVDLTDANVTPLSEDHVRAWGFENAPPHWGWFCGDFCYYRAADWDSGFAHYLLIEQDVLITGHALQKFVDALADAGPIHAGATRLTNQMTQPAKFSADLLLVNRSDRVSCIFPLTIASLHQIEKMKALRSVADAKSANLNDEAIFGSSAFEHSVDPIDFAALMPDLFSAQTFETNPPHLYEGLSQTDQDAFWHPVVSYDLVLRRIETGEKRYGARRLRKVLQEAPPPLRDTILRKLADAKATR